MERALKRMILGNQAIAYGALAAGVDVVTGYPGTPSSEVIPEIIRYAAQNNPAPYAEWSVNEKVAVEIAAAAAWSGKRAMATMKMSGCNVAADSILSIAYSGTRGGLVFYIADDPGAEAGMPEQDTRVFAQWAGLPVLETESPQQAYDVCSFAFDLSERTELPVIVRSVTSVAHEMELVEADFLYAPLKRDPVFDRDIERFTKAGSAICTQQHRNLLRRLEKAEEIIHGQNINRWLKNDSSLSVVSAGNVNPFVSECLSSTDGISVLYLQATYPIDRRALDEVFSCSARILVLEELEPVVERMVRSEASLHGWKGEIFGKLDARLPRVGKYTQGVIRKGLYLLASGGDGIDADVETYPAHAEESAEDIPAVKHPITFCAGCPHRGTYLALNRALKKNKLDRGETIVTGDIGCTILGMNPPFDSCWTEVSMGSSIGFAQGFMRAGMEKPVIATIGDSTFFHAGVQPLINAVQHRSDILLIILDNGWTSMTGFQVNPGTVETLQPPGQTRVDIVQVVRSLGVDVVETMHPFSQDQAADIMDRLLMMKGVRVIISQEECALVRMRREPRNIHYAIDSDTCTFCKACMRETVCPALVPVFDEDSGSEAGGKKNKGVMTIDPDLCTGCGLCATCCRFRAIHPAREEVHV
jgi:indolepyruvate ferredoxin oxidoreductase alpha subunit